MQSGNGLPHPLVQRACKSGSICTNIKGDPADLDVKAQAAVQELIDPPVNCRAAPEHMRPAESMTALATGETRL